MSQVKDDRRSAGAGALTRRELLTGGVAALGLGATACETGDPYAIVKPPVPGAEHWRRFEEKTIVSACAQCDAGCGIRVRVVEGRAVKIDGQPDNPINRGGIGPRGLAGLQVLYDPDRIEQPLRRKGPRGAGAWEPVSWESALAELGVACAACASAASRSAWRSCAAASAACCASCGSASPPPTAPRTSSTAPRAAAAPSRRRAGRCRASARSRPTNGSRRATS